MSCGPVCKITNTVGNCMATGCQTDTTNWSPRTSSPRWSKRSRASVSPVTNSHMLTSKPTTTTPTAQKRHDQEFFPAGQHPAEPDFYHCGGPGAAVGP